ncbi:electron transport complex, RnfABCDGE type, C subunit [Treponema socranskii subsp. socranskii VPI DR56BR1116 = ATCC 35536]|uniref:Ion-translocating oxidoreductase complex subunit C n=2 Tax=Treponema socranskii TaxID=53419 RepID=U1FBE5_TRESO|nr:electron transport complex, RnfABCDGE type, C subunit [Treponema socranskii subsp. socranskii VPI DR56BR1116 = ATCC 35536]
MKEYHTIRFMRMFTFKGGVYPPDRKERTRDGTITDAFPSTKRVTIPVTMGGSPNECTVNVGDRVVKGQVIAASDKYMSVPVHASITGKVAQIAPHAVAGGAQVPCVTIESDGSDATAYMSPLDPFSCDAKDVLERIRLAGIVGMGCASFPTYVKLSPPDGTKIEYVIVNASECEPYLTVDYHTVKESCKKVIDGLAIEMHIFGCRGIVALENNKLDLISGINEAIAEANHTNDIEIKIVKTKYPQGGEKNLIAAILKREVPAGWLPAHVGCIVSNVCTVCAISDAFRLGKPLIERAFTVSGGACENPANIRVPVGTLVEDLLGDVVRVNDDEIAQILSGGPMMGIASADAAFPVVKGTSGVLFLTKKEIHIGEEEPCLGCGRCIPSCPMRLSPVMMARSLKANDYDAAVKFGLTDCIECGSCAYVCPAHVRLVHRFKLGKGVVKTRAAKKNAAGKAAGGK